MRALSLWITFSNMLLHFFLQKIQSIFILKPQWGVEDIDILDASIFQQKGLGIQLLIQLILKHSPHLPPTRLAVRKVK